MIVSASRREDVPAFRMDWLMDRLRSGWYDVPNPFDARRARRVALDPASVDLLVLWTRNPSPIVPRARELESMGYRFYVHATITGYPPPLEPGTLRDADAVAAFSALSGLVGPDRVLWRYDPVIVSRELDADWHAQNFERLASLLEGRTRRVTLSLVDEYARTRARLEAAGLSDVVFGSSRVEAARRAAAEGTAPDAIGAPAPATQGELFDAPHALPPEPYPGLIARLAAIARERGMEAVSCAEPYDLSSLGVARGACVDAALARKLFGVEVEAAKDRGQRKACACAPSVDIGAYGRCPARCAYCYARR